MTLDGVRNPRLFVWTSSLAALMLQSLPLSKMLSILWPQFFVLCVLYWSTMAPRVGDILIAFLGGLVLDVLQGTQLGQHALALSLVAYLAIRFHLMTRAKPLFEQTLLVVLILAIYEGVLWAIDGWSGLQARNWERWMHIIPGAICWPLIVGLLGRLHAPR
ncbi:MAG: rod shape-determining protein MreD [Nevskiaceae bacterium]|jgi:rod shape-determining protein MreD|nr:rod shape-determining protein MreD [Nevskiaceae bacterium]